MKSLVSKQKGFLTLVVLTALVLSCGSCSRAQENAAIGPEKKLIAFAADLVQPEYLKRFISDLEKLPLDGIVMSIHEDGYPIEKIGLGGVGRNNLWFGGRAYKRSDFQKTIAVMKAIRFQRFTDNFMDFNAGGDIRGLGVPDWFSDDWSRVSGNAAVAAYVAKEGGLKGLFIDTEAYGNGGPGGPWKHPYSYKKYSDFYDGKPPHSLAECKVQARKRGKEFAQAITAVYPDITLVFMLDTGWTGEPTYELLSAFVDGVLEGCGDKATIVDGGERSYPLITYESLANFRERAEKRSSRRSQNPELYKNKVQYAVGIWIDHVPDKFGGWHTDPKDLEKNYRSPEELEHTLYSALTVSDKYAWLFVIHPQVWWQPHLLKPENVAQQMEYSPGWRCKLCPHSEIPKAYLDAIKNSRKPHDLNRKP